MERYETAKPSKDLSGIVRIAGAEVNTFLFVFLRAVRVKMFLVACKSLPRIKSGASLVPPRPFLQRRGKKGGVGSRTPIKAWNGHACMPPYHNPLTEGGLNILPLF